MVTLVATYRKSGILEASDNTLHTFCRVLVGVHVKITGLIFTFLQFSLNNPFSEY